MATLCTKSWINHMRHITCSLKPSFAHENCLIFAGIGFGLHCYQFLIFTYAYALIFIHGRLGPYFGCWGSLLGPYFTKKGSLLGPYPKGWGSLLVLEAVVKCVTIFIRKSHIGQDSTSGVGLLLSCEWLMRENNERTYRDKNAHRIIFVSKFTPANLQSFNKWPWAQYSQPSRTFWTPWPSCTRRGRAPTPTLCARTPENLFTQ